MTPQEEQALVQIIVQCVRAVLGTYTRDTTLAISNGQNESSAFKSPVGSRFIDVVASQGASEDSSLNGNMARSPLANRNRDDVRKALQRFLRNSEPTLAEPEPEPQQKRQLITKEDILAAYQQGQKVIVLRPDAVVTPLARQVAKDKGVELR
jgi:hypothetical protein